MRFNGLGPVPLNLVFDLLVVSAFSSPPDLFTALADLNVSAKFPPNKKLSILVFLRCSFMSFFNANNIKFLLVIESACCMSHNIRHMSINFCNNSLFFGMAFICVLIIPLRHAIALVICFCMGLLSVGWLSGQCNNQSSGRKAGVSVNYHRYDNLLDCCKYNKKKVLIYQVGYLTFV